jgi:ABC-type nitrate/sulfonate/bicarbonate transport system permease component
MTQRRRFAVYASRRHLAATVGVIALPFVFFIIFSAAIHFTISKLFADIGVSLLRMLAAYAIAATLGWLCAVLFYKGKRATVALPFFDVLQSFPTFAALPLAVTYWGPSNATIIIFLAAAIIWPLFFSVVSSLRLIKRDWEEALEISQLKGWNYVRYFLVPASMPGFITGSIVGLGDAWEALVATEIIVAAKSGLGNFFQAFSTSPTITAFGILGFLLLIFAVNKILWMPLMEKSHVMMEE